jgi:hypothetical protein
MTELFEDDEKLANEDDEILDVEGNTEAEDWSADLKVDMGSDARRRLEDLLDERKLREELDDFFDLEQ